MFDGPERNRNGNINQGAYDSDEYDFFKSMYGKNPGSVCSGMGCSTLIIIGLIAFWILDLFFN